jgi:hypothetical protein
MGHPGSGLGYPYPPNWHDYDNDFDTFAAGDWTITKVGTGTTALTNADGGVLALTTTTGATDSIFMDKVGESYVFESGKRLWFEARFKMSDASASQMVMGLQITDTTPLAVSDGVWFQKAAASTHLDIHAAKASTQTDVLNFGDLVNDTYTTLTFFYDGGTTIFYGRDGVLLGSFSSANIVNAQTMCVSFGIQNGAGAAKTMSVDYIFVSKERA